MVWVYVFILYYIGCFIALGWIFRDLLQKLEDLSRTRMTTNEQLRHLAKLHELAYIDIARMLEVPQHTVSAWMINPENSKARVMPQAKLDQLIHIIKE